MTVVDDLVQVFGWITLMAALVVVGAVVTAGVMAGAQWLGERKARGYMPRSGAARTVTPYDRDLEDDLPVITPPPDATINDIVAAAARAARQLDTAVQQQRTIDAMEQQFDPRSGHPSRRDGAA
jgi:hypothetical protein